MVVDWFIRVNKKIAILIITTIYLSCLVMVNAFAFEQSSAIVKIGPMALHLANVGEYNLKKLRYMAQDDEGFFWLAVGPRLFRYDGVHMQPHDILVNGKPLIGNISKLVIDGENIWLSVRGLGLVHYLPAQNITALYSHIADDPSTISSNTITSMQLVGDDVIWLATTKGVTRFSRKNKTAERLNHLLMPIAGTDTKAKRIFQVFQDRQERVWVSVLRGGVYMTTQGKQHHFNYEKDNDKGLNHSYGYLVYQANDDVIWIGDRYGINRYQPNSQDFTRFPIELSQYSKNRYSNVTSFAEDSEGNLYIGTEHNGLQQLNKGADKPFTVVEDILYTEAVSALDIRQIITDSSGVMWAVGYGSGLYKVKPNSKGLQHFGVPKGWQRGLATLFTDMQGHTWLGSRENLFRLNPQTERFELVLKDIGNAGLITQLPDGDLLLAMGGMGLKRFDPDTNALTVFSNDSGEEIGAPIPTYQSVTVDAEGTLWVGLFGPGGVYRLRRGEQQFEQVLKGNTIESLLAVGNRIYAGLRLKGLRIYDKKSEKWLDEDFSAYDTGHVWQVATDKAGRIWLATKKQGLAILDPINLTLDFIGVSQGLASNDVRAIVTTDDNQIWLTTALGLSLLTFAEQDINKVKIDNFDTRHGLRIEAYRPEFAGFDNDGFLWVGGALLLSRVDTKTWLANQMQPVKEGVLFSDFRLFNEPMMMGDKLSPLSKPINQIEHLDLSHRDHWFSIAFAAQDQRITDRARYAYLLQGFNKDWIETNHLNAMATFTSLPADDYVLKVKTTDYNGSWQPDYRALSITVHPPWYLTTWAYVVYVLLVLAAIYGFFVYRTRALVARANALEQGVIERTATINQLVGQKDRLIEQKDKMFANISHEFKTPLTLILNPLDSIEIDKTSSSAKRHVQMMKRNGQRLLRMVEQLLELSKLETTDVDERRNYSLAQTLNMLLTSFQPLVDSKNLTLKTVSYEDVVLSLKVDALDMILTNLISNAIKYTPVDGTISIDVRQHDGKVQVAVSDTGIGIDEQNQEIVFNRFTRANETHSENIPGAGIGLALVKELVESHQGSIRLDSQLGRGSTFTIELPIVVGEDTQVSDISGISQSSQIEIDSLATVENESQTSTTVSETASEEAVSTQATILLIDDNADMLTLLKDALSSHFTCLTAVNGEQGVASAIEHLPDLVISDVMMPGISGFDVLNQLKANQMTSHIPVVLLTAKGDVQSRMQGWAENADEYLEKPFNSAELLMRIESLLSVRALLRHRYQREFTASNVVIDSQRSSQELEVKQDKQQSLNSVNQAFLDRINGVLEKHYSDESLDVGFLASELAMSHRQLGRKMKSLLDLTPAETIRSFRLKKAAEQLAQGATAGVVAYDVGFTSHSYFSQCFKAQYDCLPSAYADKVT